MEVVECLEDESCCSFNVNKDTKEKENTSISAEDWKVALDFESSDDEQSDDNDDDDLEPRNSKYRRYISPLEAREKYLKKQLREVRKYFRRIVNVCRKEYEQRLDILLSEPKK